jgi:osmotically-inducible protein OsmY
MTSRNSAMTFVYLLVLMLPLGLGGCAGALVVGGLAAAGGAGYEASQERGLGGGAEDFALKTDIETALGKANPALQNGVSVTVYGGRVLLTGRAPSPEMKTLASQVARQYRGVRAVYDELQVGQAETPWELSQDAWITARLRSELILDPDIRSVNYTIDTADHAVYLIGSARSQAEIERATGVARYVPGVRRVVSYMEIRPGAPVAAQGPVSAPTPSAGLDTPSAAPRAPIEVQRL